MIATNELMHQWAIIWWHMIANNDISPLVAYDMEWVSPLGA